MAGKLTMASLSRAYPFRRFLAQRWWFLLLLGPKLYRAAAYSESGIIPALVITGAILGGWYFVVLLDLRRRLMEISAMVDQAQTAGRGGPQ